VLDLDIAGWNLELSELYAMESIERFVRLLKTVAARRRFNPWWEADKRNDVGRNAPSIRRNS